jgi:putative membrane protein
MNGRSKRQLARAFCLFVAVGASSLRAHDISSRVVSFPEVPPWSFEPGVVIPMVLAAVGYGMGLRHLPPRFWRTGLCFLSGWLVLALALISPLHQLGSLLFVAHMIQHELLMIGAAPLLVLGRPGLVLLRVLPPRLARKVTHACETAHLTAMWRGLTHPAVAWAVHAFALWAWHIPSWFEATLAHEWIHAAQHASFFGTGLWFWYSVFRGPHRAADYGWSIMNLFVTALHTSVLGALITFAPQPWYGSYAATARPWGLSALEDQQLGGLVMWIPGGIMYTSVALALAVGWLHSAREWTSAAETNA